jgi:hypothetical protein
VVAVAQLVESRIVIPVVVGSSPIGHPKKFNDLAHFSKWALLFLEDEIPIFPRSIVATIVQDCPHCGANHVAFPVIDVHENPVLNCGNLTSSTYNVFGWCTACGGPYSAIVRSVGSRKDPQKYQGNLANARDQFVLMDFFPTKKTSISPEHVPVPAARAFVQGAESLSDGRYSAAIAMFRRAIDVGTKQFSQDVDVWKLEKRIDKLHSEGLITKDLKDWAHKIRLEGNEAIHEIDEPTKK